MNNQIIPAEQGFRAMSRFLEQYYNKIGTKGDLAAVLSDIQMMPDGRPPVPPACEDWLKAVRIVLKDTPH
jgi:hypothetical protein